VPLPFDDSSGIVPVPLARKSGSSRDTVTPPSQVIKRTKPGSSARAFSSTVAVQVVVTSSGKPRVVTIMLVSVTSAVRFTVG
jgi:hypothetical protein